eukprot:tig00000383_g24717.t1
MPQVRFEKVEAHGDVVRLTGPTFQASVQILHDGIVRIFTYHRPEDAAKGSFAIDPAARVGVPVRVDAGAGGAHTIRPAAGGAELTVRTLEPFAWSWGSLEAVAMEAHRFLELGRTVDYLALSTGEGDPYAETCDGHVLGNGFTLSFKEPRGRRYYGLGERSGSLDKKGRTYINWTTDEWDHKPDIDPMYVACPYFMALEADPGGACWGMYLDETWRTAFDLAYAEPDRSHVRTDGPTFDLYLIPGPTPREVVSRLTRLTGRPQLPPLWALGFHQCRWSYPDAASVAAVVKRYRELALPLDCIWLDIDYMDAYKVFTFSKARFPDPKGLIEGLRAEHGVRTVVIVDPGVKKEAGYSVYDEGHRSAAFVRSRRDEDLVGKVWPDPAVWPDFTQEHVRRWWGDLHAAYTDAGIAGIWNDMNEPSAFQQPHGSSEGRSLPLGAKHGGRWHAEVHNVYGQQMCRATHEGLLRLRPERRPFVLTRSGFPGVQRHAWLWTGDNAAYYTLMEMSLPTVMNMGLSGMPLTGADIGGFKADCTGELLARWTWLGALYPFMRNHAAKGTRRQEPWAFGEPWLSHCRAALRFRYRILPFMYTAVREACVSGLPPFRPLLFDFPADPETHPVDDQVLVGDGLMAAPILRQGATRRAVYFPKGARFVDFWTGEEQGEGAWALAACPLERGLLLYCRAGTAVATDGRETALHTGTALWGDEGGLVWHLPLPAAGEVDVRGTVYEDEGEGPLADAAGCLGGGGRVRVLEGRLEGASLRLRQRFAAGPGEPGPCALHLVRPGHPPRTLPLPAGTAELSIAL